MECHSCNSELISEQILPDEKQYLCKNEQCELFNEGKSVIIFTTRYDGTWLLLERGIFIQQNKVGDTFLWQHQEGKADIYFPWISMPFPISQKLGANVKKWKPRVEKIRKQIKLLKAFM